jgi:hypothetical protein
VKAGIGSEVGLYMDTPRLLEVGHFIETPTGRTYEITTLRRQERGKHKGRWHIRALVVSRASVPDEATVHPILWYSR